MSVAYCYFCLERLQDCKCPECEGDCGNHIIYGDLRKAYLQGYRDAKEGEKENL